jgi:diguanylate cyclase (GGDEF)-like protein
MKVLVLDKNLSELQAIAAQLKDLEFDILHSTNPENAVSLYQSYSPDIIVMDPDFPEVHGYDIINQIREIDDDDTSVLFLSKNLTSTDIVSGISIGGECLSKPVNAALLKAKLLEIKRKIVMKQRYVQMSEQLQKATEELKEFTHIDPLTGLINRQYLHESIQVEISRGIRYQQPVAVVYIELDCFRKYFESYGSQQSNICLKQMAGIISSHCRRSVDIAAHCGTELFALVFPDTTAENAMSLAQRVCESIEAAQIPHDSSSVSNVCTVSIGVTSSIPQQGEKKENLLKLADAALNQARNAGHNCVELVNFFTVKSKNLGSKIA